MSPQPCTGLVICPVCGGALSDHGRSLQCEARHTFDRSRAGYVDLLPAGHGRSKIRGDTAAMLRARRRILELGYFEPLSKRLNEVSDLFLRDRRTVAYRARRPLAVADAGCGEGYYVGNLQRFTDSGTTVDCFFGFDISAAAVRLAARAYPRISFFVNDVRHRICLASQSVDLLLDVFAPRNTQEFARVLSPDGQLFVVIPQAGHLGELRQRLALLRIAPDKPERVVQQLQDGFDLVNQDALEYQVDIAATDLLDVLQMTPNFWHLDDEARAQVAVMDGCQITFAITILRLRRRGPG